MNLEEKQITLRKLQSDENSVICSKAINEETQLPIVVTQEAYITSEEKVEDYEERTIAEILDEVNAGIEALENPEAKPMEMRAASENPSQEDEEKRKTILDKYKELKHRLEDFIL